LYKIQGHGFNRGTWNFYWSNFANITKTAETYKNYLIEYFEDRFNDFESYKVFDILKFDTIDYQRKLHGKTEIENLLTHLKTLPYIDLTQDNNVITEEWNNIKSYIYVNCRGKSNEEIYQTLHDFGIFKVFNPIIS